MSTGTVLYDTQVNIKTRQREPSLLTHKEGVVARLSGLSKEEVIAAFDYINTYTFLADYNPTGFGPVIIESSEPDKIYIEDKDNTIKTLYAIIKASNYYYRKDQYITA